MTTVPRRTLLRYLLFALFVAFGGRTTYRWSNIDKRRKDLAENLKATSNSSKHVRLRLINEAFSGNGQTFSDEKLFYTFKVHELDKLNLPSGDLVAADAITTPDRPAFDTRLPAGRYPVSIAIKQILTKGKQGNTGNQRVAYAKLSITDKPVAQWLLATTCKPDPKHLDDDEYYGYPVDAGVGSFMDVRASKILCGIHDSGERIIAELERHDVESWSWANFVVDPVGGLNVIVFSSGYGDGTYPTYYGLTNNGEIACVVTDFMIV